ncbi:ATP-binding protein [Ureaplasma ceti]|uniref:MPN635 N-terminal domain-containing protein n=1 Tax=Ureaplasma ceti TaxID=3119530 RepID=A0ABP9U5P5_9BACT
MKEYEKQLIDLNIKTILSDWTPADAVRELIANALDERLISQTQDIQVCYDKTQQTCIIQDYGRGIKPSDFVQNESLEKNERTDVIGKFGIGLKDALAVLNRNKIQVSIMSKYGTFLPIIRQKTGIEEEMKTIYIKYDIYSLISVGTKIELHGLSVADYEKAMSLFLAFQNVRPVATSNKGEIYQTSNSSIYLNGLKISEDSGLLFSYNITSPNKLLKKNLNRERKNVSRDAYRDCVLNILLNIDNDSQRDDVFQYILQHKDDTENNEWSFIDVKKLIFEHLTKVNNKYLIVSEEQVQDPNCAKYLQYAEKDGKEILVFNQKDYSSLSKQNNDYTISAWWRNKIDAYKPIEVSVEELNEVEKQNWLLGQKFIHELRKKLIFNNELSLQKQYLDEYKWIIIDSHPEYEGLTNYCSKEILIVRRDLSNLSELLGVLLHEATHAITLTSDSTIAFESCLTDFLGILAYWLIKKED